MGIPPSNAAGGPNASGGAPADPSMEDILASIRRILNEDEAAVPQHPQAGVEPAQAVEPAPAVEEDVLELDQSMMVEAPLAEPDPAPVHAAAEEPVPAPPPLPLPPPLVAIPPPVHEPAAAAVPVAMPESGRGSDLLAPESEAATLSAMGSLVRTLSAERQTQVHRGGPTIEDLVREEMRPLLKTWLDQHLPPMVERLVRSEIERLMGRLAP